LGGKTYEDVVDGTKWAIAQGIADPQRVAILGWSFGGYVALVGAQRDADLFRCAISIAGPSDLGMLISEESRYLNMAEVAQKQIGTDKEKIRRDSPRLHASEVTIPVLLIHGDRDAQVDLEQSQSMDAALTRSGKAHRFVMIKDAGASDDLSSPLFISPEAPGNHSLVWHRLIGVRARLQQQESRRCCVTNSLPPNYRAPPSAAGAARPQCGPSHRRPTVARSSGMPR